MQRANDVELSTRIHLDLITNLSSVGGPESIASSVRDCEANVTSIGRPDLQARFHIALAQIEGQRGLFKEADAHLRVAEELLAVAPNLWLQGLLYLNSSTLHALRMASTEGVKLAERALQCAELSGHHRTKLGAIGNIAYLSLSNNDIAAARAKCEAGLQMASGVSDVRVALLETLAQATLADRQPSKCRDLLSEIDEISSTDPHLRLSWYSLATVLTRVRLSQQEEAWELSLSSCVPGIALAADHRDRLHQISLRILGADALIELGRLDEATVYINQATEHSEDVPIAIFAEVERARAALIARSVGPQEARRPFERALRLLAALGGIAPRMDAAKSYQRVMRLESDEISRQIDTQPWNVGPLIKHTLPGKTRQGEETTCGAPEEYRGIEMSDAAALGQLISRPDLLKRIS